MASGNTFLSLAASGIQELLSAISAFTGNANEIVATDGTGRIDASLLPVGVGSLTVSATAVGTVAAGDFVDYFDNAGIPSVRKADDALGIPANGFVLVAIPDTTVGTVFLRGSNTAVSGLVAGQKYFLAANGLVDQSPDVAINGSVVQLLGTAVSATELVMNQPDNYTIINV